jgi:AraC-like DNA-binding protein
MRAAVELALKVGGVACGPIGNHGLVFLLERVKPRSRTRPVLDDLVAKAASLARRFGLRLCAGVAEGHESKLTLPARYRAALGAAEQAHLKNASVVYAVPHGNQAIEDLRLQRVRLAESVRERPDVLTSRFDVYVEAVLAACGYHLERTRAELGAGFERLLEPLPAVGVLSHKDQRAIFASLERGAQSAITVSELVTAYRTSVRELEASLGNASEARREHATRDSVALIRERFAEKLSIRELARVAGLAPDYFSKLFKRHEGVTPELYLHQVRMDRARRMLRESKLGVEVVAKLCGFSSRNYFHRAFKRETKMTPLAYRRSRS